MPHAAVVNRPRAWVALVPAAVAALLAACSAGGGTAAGGTTAPTPTAVPGSGSTPTPGDAGTGGPSTTPASTAAPAATTPRASTATVTRSATPSATRAVAGATLVLEPDGLGVLDATTHVTHLRFGSDAGVVRTAVGRLLGPLTTSPLPECGQGPRTGVSAGRFSLLLDGRRFVGWTDQSTTGRRLTTLQGVGVGSTLAQLRAALGTVRLQDGSLGTEWTTTEGGLSGLVSSTSPGARVTVVAAGETCFFR